jgi:TonB family protein
MSRPRSRPGSVSLALACALTAVFPMGGAAGVRADDVPAARAAVAAARTLVPPRLLTFVEAPYPEAAKAAGRETSVELEIAIDERGAVTTATVLRAAGDGFDEAALAAARRFVFAPARRGDVAIPARIRYRYVFALDKAPPPARARRSPPDAREPAPRGRAEG